ncbi:uroporphyrinogen-III synthase [Simplicispira psychrophila]|uniref:uroporphyrinogen-III synthase n=1 Tax=Simplicispira psychrophila TaxID=80882 RepID=UPI00048042AD|nr:uroporphyrinogen-III synthase [Simplicispira psychrophila]
MTTPSVIVTRPLHEAQQWVTALQQRNIEALALPLITIGPAPDGPALQAVRERVTDYRAIMLVSGNAAQYFFDENTALTLAGQALLAIKTRVWSPGPGTAQTLQRLGIPAAQIDCPAHDAVQFDSEALWAQVHSQIIPGDRVLIVRGAEADAPPQGTGRDWLAQQIQAAGGQVEFVVAYTRSAPRFTPAQITQAQDGARSGALWLLSSSQALAHLRAALPGQDWRSACALATHPRIAQAARAAGFGAVHECRPALEDVAAAIEAGCTVGAPRAS